VRLRVAVRMCWCCLVYVYSVGFKRCSYAAALARLPTKAV
jgi:hypothetical protein